jgi:hypothetical protein
LAKELNKLGTKIGWACSVWVVDVWHSDGLGYQLPLTLSMADDRFNCVLALPMPEPTTVRQVLD